jgi:hypothetical protein
MPSAETSRRGLALKSRLFVKGIQKDDIDGSGLVHATLLKAFLAGKKNLPVGKMMMQ